MPRKPASKAEKVYHAFFRGECEEHRGHTMHCWSYDDMSWLMMVILKEWHEENGFKCRVYRWRGPAPPVSDPEPEDMQLADLPY